MLVSPLIRVPVLWHQLVRKSDFDTLARRAMATILLGLATYHLLLTVLTVSSFGLRYPFMDQFRLNLRYLSIPFPQNVLELENGHRPVLPGIVRFIELNWLGGTQLLQKLTALLAAIGVAAILLVGIKRDKWKHAVLVAASVCTFLTLLTWNSNARMFIHAYEAMHVFYVTLFLAVAIHFIVRAPIERGLKAIAIPIAACIGATFSFGPGIASFAAIMAIAILQRREPKVFGLIAVAALITFVLYYFALPGSEIVRGATSGFSVRASIFFALARVGAIFAESLRVFFPGLATQGIVAASAGAVGIGICITSIVRRWYRRQHFADSELLGVGLFVFGLSTNILIAINRTTYFFEHTEQLFADRYLFWSCVTWLGLVIYGLCRLTTATPGKQHAAGVAVALFSLIAIAPAIEAYQWSAQVRRVSELAAIAMKLGIWNVSQIAEISDFDPGDTYRAFVEMRKRNLGLLGASTSMRLGNTVRTSSPQLSMPVTITAVAGASSTDQEITMISGELPPELAALEENAELWVADAEGVVVGRVGFTNTGGRARNIVRLDLPALVGIQGFVVGSRPPAFLFAVEENDATKGLARMLPGVTGLRQSR